jgi:hypothetical protein
MANLQGLAAGLERLEQRVERLIQSGGTSTVINKDGDVTIDALNRHWSP